MVQSHKDRVREMEKEISELKSALAKNEREIEGLLQQLAKVKEELEKMRQRFPGWRDQDGRTIRHGSEFW